MIWYVMLKTMKFLMKNNINSIEKLIKKLNYFYLKRSRINKNKNEPSIRKTIFSKINR